jgi:hypothetical protein
VYSFTERGREERKRAEPLSYLREEGGGERGGGGLEWNGTLFPLRPLNSHFWILP